MVVGALGQQSEGLPPGPFHYKQAENRQCSVAEHALNNRDRLIILIVLGEIEANYNFGCLFLPVDKSPNIFGTIYDSLSNFVLWRIGISRVAQELEANGIVRCERTRR